MPAKQAEGFAGRFLILARNSFVLAALAAGLAALLALLLGFAARDGKVLPRWRPGSSAWATRCPVR
jgi:ABC-type Fe3+ transport system permease subunit